MAVDIVSHLEYFYNTLDCTHRTKNPFESPGSYPCLNYREHDPSSSADSSSQPREKTLFQLHRSIIFPNSAWPEKLHSRSLGSSDISPNAAGMFLNVNN